MSESPSIPPDPNDEQPVPGGWKQPTVIGTWRKPDTEKEAVTGWRVPTLPQDLKQEPEQAGAWHLPQPEDTVFTPEDSIEVRPPEDMLMQFQESAGEVVELTPDTAEEQDENELAPEDLMALIDSIDSTDDDFDTVHMSELIALATLATEEPGAQVVRGEEAPPPEITDESDMPDEHDTGEVLTQLSPAEQVMLQSAEDIEGVDEDIASDPASYARQRLIELGIGEEGGEQVPADHDPADYARQRLIELGIEEETPLPQDTETLSLREQEIVRRFNESREKVHALREMLSQGVLSQEQFNEELLKTMVQDDDQIFWVMAPDRDVWYKSEHNEWVEAVPEVLERAGATGPFGQMIEEPLDYFTDRAASASSQADTAQQFARPDIPLDADNMPLREMDADATVPSRAVYDEFDDQATVPGRTIPTATLQAEPVSYGNIEKPLDEGFIGLDEEPDTSIHRRAMERQRRSMARTLAIVAAIGTGLIFLFLAGSVALALLWYQGIVSDWDLEIAALAAFEPEFQTVTILDTNGDEIARLSREGDDRRPVDLEDISPYMIHAVISLEDARFYENPGWDLFAIMRAFWQNLLSGEIESGASTITQQVARDLVLRDRALTADRKLNEVIVAGELTRRYSKNEILYLYLNDVTFFGNQTYGVEAAAQFYFNKPARDLTLPESALLASIIRSPDTIEPVNNRQTALDQMNTAMQRMAQTGCLNFLHVPPTGNSVFCVTPSDLESPVVARDKARVEVREFQSRQFGVRYPHFTILVQNQLEALFGTTEVYRAGYVVRTTLDSRLQDRAQSALTQRVNDLASNGVNAGAIMVTDPRNGAILSLVGSPNFNDEEFAGQIDYGRSYQQPGSSIKPVLYAAALQGFVQNGEQRYYTPASILWDVDTTFANNYRPVNFDRQFRGPVSLRSALQMSINVPAVRVIADMGADVFRSMGEAMGLRFRDDAFFGPASALGATEVRLYDMMQVYGTIANNGTRMRLYTIESITDANGNSVAVPAREEPLQALRPATAYLLQNILSDDQARAPQFGLNSSLTISGLPTQDVVGAKTGTTDNQRDLWTMGFTNNRVVGVWLGTYDDASTRGNLTGFTATSPLWNAVMRAALDGNNPRRFAQPERIAPMQVCADTGTQPDATCATVRNELFEVTQPPPPADDGFLVNLRIDSWSGLRANEFCPDNVIEGQFVNITDAAVVNWLNGPGQNYARRVGLNPPVTPAPQGACDQNTPIPTARIASPDGGQTVMGVIPVIGQVSAQGFDRYQLEIAPAGSNNFQPISDPVLQQRPDAGSTLATWNTTTIPNGDYTLRLVVIAQNGGYVHRSIPVRVDNPAPTATPEPTQMPEVFPTDSAQVPIPFDTLPPLDPNGPTPTIDPTG